MANITKLHLTGSTTGLPIELTDTATIGQTIHTATNTANFFDEIWLYVDNDNATIEPLTIEWGGGTDITETMKFSIAASAEVKLIIPGLLLSGGLLFTAFVTNANRPKINGYVNRIDQS